jgi:hypothetical protein
VIRTRASRGRMRNTSIVADEEYGSLRQEIIERQGRRMATASGTVVVVTAVLGWIVQSPRRWVWADASAILLVAIASAAWLTYVFGMNAVRIGTYIQVFHEPERRGWESRNLLARRPVAANLNRGLAVVYAGLATISIFAPYVAAGHRAVSSGSYAIFGVALAGASVAIIYLWRLQRDRAPRLESWRPPRAATSTPLRAGAVRCAWPGATSGFALEREFPGSHSSTLTTARPGWRRTRLSCTRSSASAASPGRAEYPARSIVAPETLGGGSRRCRGQTSFE